MQKNRIVLSLLALALVAASLQAAFVERMDLAEVCSRADKIFRGTVISVTPGEIEAGGAVFPTVTYRLKVSEAFQGEFEAKGDLRMAEITMLAPVKSITVGDQRSLSPIGDLPRLEVGGDYLLMTSRPSAIGLSAPIGLDQGTYTIQGKGNALTAVNALGETFNYQAMASAIRAAVTQ